ncbi:site-specific integrase [Streptomyces sp. AcE210]|uniref:site-specific integrase n=1 Tax=Streptomyces sp. AcE210 TaxID=2292703 RepID=UPI00105867CC|nr:site-specific integrase [Streptomyces sp. AcE210]
MRNALNAAVRTRRLAYNPAAYAVPARPAAPERLCWTPAQAAAFLRHNASAYADQLTDLFEVMIGTGLRRGEALGLHWHDVHLAERRLYVRWTLTAVGNNHLHLGPPKTRASRAWIALSPRVTAALTRQARYYHALLPAGPPLEGLVFAHADGSPLRPQWVLDQLRRRTAELDLPRIGLHDLRHTAATIMISSGVPLAIVSKTLRHSTLSTTLNTYGHLLAYAARDAVSALGTALDHADHDNLTAPTASMAA